MSKLSRKDVEAAARALEGRVVRTPCTRSRVLSQMTGADVWIKFENFQFTASFKDRGALNRMLQLTEAEKAAGVCAMSAGNHAQAVAYRASQLGIGSTIVMPAGTPFTKVKNTRELGAEVILRGETLADAQQFVETELVGKRGLAQVHPYDDPFVIAGQGTVALEMLEDAPGLDTLVVPIGGGGLVSGIALATQGAGEDIRVIGVESAGYCSAFAAIEGDPSLARGGTTIAEGIAVKNIGQLTLEIIRTQVAELMRVEEPAIERAIGLLASVEKVVAEGAGATALAAVLTDPARFAGRKVGVVLTGGNIDTRLLASVLMRQMVHESRLVSLSVHIEDRPGFLARVAGFVGASGGNIVQVHHERLGGSHARTATLEMLVEVQDEGHARQIMVDLEAQGLKVRRRQADFGELE